MKKLLVSMLSAAMLFSLAACGANKDETTAASAGSETAAAETPATVTVTTLNADKEAVELEVPFDPQRVAVMDLAVLDILDNIGTGERVVGVSKGSSIDYLQDYVANEEIPNLGTIKEADLEAVMACEPDVIFIGGRLAAQYDALSEIAPVVYLGSDPEIGVVASTEKNARTVASIFGKEDEITALMDDYNARIEKLQAAAEGQSAVIGMVTSGGFNVLGNDGRCSIIGTEIGFENLGLDAAAANAAAKSGGGTGEAKNEGSGKGDGAAKGESAESSSPHGEESSFELLVSLNPDYIFVMDRDAAINAEGAKLAQEVMENELVMQTDAYKNGQIVYLEHPAVWYTAEGGITALDVMLGDLETGLL